jgi:S-adenosylmethionine synthetase
VWQTNKIPLDAIDKLIREFFPIRPADIISQLDLRRPIFKSTAAYGHFGREEPDFTWEKTDKVKLLKAEAKI